MSNDKTDKERIEELQQMDEYDYRDDFEGVGALEDELADLLKKYNGEYDHFDKLFTLSLMAKLEYELSASLDGQDWEGYTFPQIVGMINESLDEELRWEDIDIE